MKSIKVLPLACLMALGFAGNTTAWAQAATAKSAASADTAIPAGFASRKDAVSYAIGVTTARQLVHDGVEIDAANVLKGMQDAIAGGRTAIPDKEIKAIMNTLVTDMRQKMAANRHEAESINKKKGDEFRAAFAKEAGAVTMPNGVLYKVLQAGSGAKPTIDDAIEVIYRGALIDGKEFDATPAGQATTLKMSALIVGWREAVKQMPIGSRWQIVIPPNLAYGARGVGSDIGPNETLVFDVDLKGTTKAAL